MMAKSQFRIPYSAFTLVELLVVISIIAVLMGLTLFSIQGARKSSRDARRKADLELIRHGLELYKADCNAYPAAITFGSPLVGTGTPSTCVTTPAYISTIPQDSMNPNRTYRYNRTANTTYELCAGLEQVSVAATPCTGGCGTGVTCSYRIANP